MKRVIANTPLFCQSEYLDLSTQVNEYVVKLLDKCRGNEELDVLLNKTGPPDLEMYEPLARLNLAIQYGQKKVSQL